MPASILDQEFVVLATALAQNAIAYNQWRKDQDLQNAYDNTA